MNKVMPIVFSDDLSDDIVALAKIEQIHRRVSQLGYWINEGHCRVMKQDADHVCIRVNTEFFRDRTEDFPTETLMARISLALASGITDRDHRPPIMDYHPTDTLSFDRVSGIGSNHHDTAELLAVGYNNVAKLSRNYVKRKDYRSGNKLETKP
jgi:hypothetical protein